MQLMSLTESITGEYKKLPLHHLAVSSKILGEKSFKLQLDAYPEGVRSADKYCQLHFHYVCLNQASSLEALILFITKSLEVLFFFPERTLNLKF